VRRRFAPQSKRFNERLITRKQDSFRSGAWDDIPASDIPSNGIKWVKDGIVFSDRIEPRAGSSLWSTTTLPTVATEYSWSKTGYTITKTAGAAFTASDVGRFIIHDDGAHELISALLSTTQVSVNTSATHAASTAGKIRDRIYGSAFHKYKNFAVIMLGSKFYYSTPTLATWNEIYLCGNLTLIPDPSDSSFRELDGWLICFNVNGIYKIDLNLTTPIYYKINVSNPKFDYIPTSIGETSALIYGNRYTYEMSRIRNGTSTILPLDRTVSGAIIDQVGATCSVDSSGKDYGTVYTARPKGEGSTTYGVLTGGALLSSFDTPSEWSVITDGHFKITIGDGVPANNVTKEVVCNFSNVVSMEEVALEIQNKLKDAFSATPFAVTCVFSSDHFIITATNEGGTVTVTSAGTGGTNIGDNVGVGATDALQMRSTVGVVTNPAYTTSQIISNLHVPTNTTAEFHADHFTHYSIYRSLDVGKNGVDPITGSGNNPELFIWLMDLPVAKAFYGTYLNDGNSFTASQQTFAKEDVGSILRLLNPADSIIYDLTILSYVSPTVVICSAAAFSCTSYASIGGGTPFYGSTNAGGTSFVATTNMFSISDIGRQIFFSDGSVATIISCSSDTPITTVGITTVSQKTNMAGTFKPTSRNFTDTVRDDYSGSVTTIKSLRPRAAGWSLQNRFFSPLPNGQIGAISGMFMFSALRNSYMMGYSQMPSNQTYYAGNYDASIQFDVYKGKITEMVEFTDELIVILTNMTISHPTNTFGQDTTRSAVGIITAVIAGKRVIDESTGCKDYGSIYKVGQNTIIIRTTDGAFRELKSKGYSDNLAFNKAMRKLEQMNTLTTSSYSTETGYLVWGSSTFASTLIPIADKCFRFAIKDEEGMGWTENTGSAWVYPEGRGCVLPILDNNGYYHTLLLDSSSGLFYDITTREGALNSGLHKCWNDKMTATPSGGTAITTEIQFPEDRGNFEHMFLNHKEGHSYFRPNNEVYKSEVVDGITYSATGYPAGFTATSKLYADGAETASATMSIININGDLCIDKVVEARRLQSILTITYAPWRVVGTQNYYVSKDKPSTQTNNITTEMGYQRELALPSLWYTPSQTATGAGGRSVLLNRVTGAIVSAMQTITKEAGADGKADSGWTPNEMSNLTTESVLSTGQGLLLWWDSDTTPTVTIGGVAQSVVKYSSAIWSLYYIKNINASGAIVISGFTHKFDVRFIQTCLETSPELTLIPYYYSDVINNNGNGVMPR
jgi:hypothetical protein